VTGICGSGCPVPDPGPYLPRLRTAAVTGDWFRGTTTRQAPDALVPGVGNSRFAPLERVNHLYLGRTRTVAVLESALHSAYPPAPRIHRHTLSDYVVVPVTVGDPLTVVDLRDPELERLVLSRDELVTTTAAHYPCTRVWAAAIQSRNRPRLGPAHGIMWHSRQADLHAQANVGGLAADLLHHTAVEAAVVWSPPAPARPVVADTPEELLRGGEPSRLLLELAGLIGAPIT